MNDDKFLAVLGLDTDGKPHAARFKRADEATVSKAAGAKGFKMGIPKSKEAAELVAKLPEGKLFDSGKGLVPFTTKPLYDKLLGVLEIKEAPAGQNAEAASPPVPTAAPVDPWARIKVGTIVLAFDPEPGPERSWWPCKVIEISEDLKTLALKFTQYPKLAAFRVKRSAVAILPSRP